MMHSAAIGAPTLLVTMRTTSTIRSVPATRTRTSSPIRTGCAALTETPLTRTWPARAAVAALDRVLKSRTAHVQLSTRAVVTKPG